MYTHVFVAIPVLHICGLLTAVAVLSAFLWDVLRRQPFNPVLAYCFLAALWLWCLATVGLDSTFFLQRLSRLPPPTILRLLGQYDRWIYPALRLGGCLLPLLPLAVATRHRVCKAWGSRFLMLVALSALAWIIGHGLDVIGPCYIPKDFTLLLGEKAGLMAWRVIRATALTGLGWASLGFWCVWYFAVFWEQPRRSPLQIPDGRTSRILPHGAFWKTP